MNSSVPAASFFSVFPLVSLLHEMRIDGVPTCKNANPSLSVDLERFADVSVLKTDTACLVHVLCTSTFALFEGA